MLIKWKNISPLTFGLVGFAIVLAHLIFWKSFDPFILIAFVAMALFELFFRRQKRFPSNALSLTAAIIFTLAIKTWVIDLRISRTNDFQPEIQTDDRILIQKTLWKLRKGDHVVFQRNSATYIGEVKNIMGPTRYELTLGNNLVANIDRQQIEGKVVFVLRKNE